MLPERFRVAAARSAGFSLALLLSMVLTFSPLLTHGQEATPHVESDSPGPGSITISGPIAFSGLQFAVTDEVGGILDAGSLEQSFYESPSLVGTPGSVAYLSVWDGFGNVR